MAKTKSRLDDDNLRDPRRKLLEDFPKRTAGADVAWDLGVHWHVGLPELEQKPTSGDSYTKINQGTAFSLASATWCQLSSQNLITTLVYTIIYIMLITAWWLDTTETLWNLLLVMYDKTVHQGL